MHNKKSREFTELSISLIALQMLELKPLVLFKTGFVLYIVYKTFVRPYHKRPLVVMAELIVHSSNFLI
jgi:hypothetical protein